MEWRLIFAGTQSLLWSISVVTAVVAAIVMFLMLRKYEAALVRRSVSFALLTLRVLVLLLLLVTFLQPVLTKTWDVDRQSRLVVAFDVSESMDTADRHASPAEMLRWAQALGMLGNAQTEHLLQDWITAYDAGQQPNWRGGADANNNAEIGEIRRQHVQGVFSEFGTMPRTEFVRRLLQAKPNDLLEKLSDVQNVDLRIFGIEDRIVPDEQLQQILATGRNDVRPTGTDAVGVLSNAISEESDGTISGVVLFTDGRQTVSVDASAEAARLGSLGIPVYCVPIGSQLSPRDLSIASVQVPQTVFLEDTARINATITSAGYVGDQVTVRLERDGEPVDERMVTVGADFFDVEFGIPTEEVGNFDYNIVTDVQPGELREDNNARDFSVSVVDNKSKVMLIEGDARWEFRYINSALDRDKRVELSTVLFDQPSLQLLNRTFLDRELPDSKTMPEKLADTDILIVGDVRPGELPESFWKAVDDAVTNDGMTLLVIPGKRYMPHAYSSPTLDQLLPVTQPRQQLAERFRRTLPDAPPSAFHMQPSAEARDLTLFKFSDPNDETPTTLKDLPGHPWAYSGTPKPIASAWANLTMETVDLDDLAVAVHQYYGFGQVLWLGIDSTWRWRMRAGDKWHHRFWGQLVRWAARNKSAAGNDQVRMTLSDLIVDESESVDVAVRWNPNFVAQLDGATVELIIEPTATSSSIPADPSTKQTPPLEPRTLVLDPLEGAPERFAGKISSLPPGEYEVRLSIRDSRIQLEQPVSSQLLIRKELSNELANISCNRDFLQQIATLSGGQLLEPWQLSELPDLVRPDSQTDNLIKEQTLYDHWAVLLLFFLLLTAEWILRKTNGLP